MGGASDPGMSSMQAFTDQHCMANFVLALAVLMMVICRLVNIHVINTLGVAPDDVPSCIECWCTDAQHELRGKHGGGSCCSDCPSSAPDTTVNTYHLQFNITYR